MLTGQADYVTNFLHSEEQHGGPGAHWLYHIVIFIIISFFTLLLLAFRNERTSWVGLQVLIYHLRSKVFNSVVGGKAAALLCFVPYTL